MLKACVTGAVLLLASNLAADVITLNPSKDNTVYQDAAGEVSNGAGPGMFTGLTGTDSIRRALVAFDLSSIPAGAVVTDVSLSLVCTRSTSPPGLNTLHRVLADWGEGDSDAGSSGGGGASADQGDATWLYRFYGDPASAWQTPGGDFAAAVSGSATISGSGAYAFTGAGMLADVQAWVADPAGNFGWLVQGVESASHTAKRFGTREYPSSSGWPVLSVTYTVPAPGPAGVLALGALAAARRRRR
jgi:hypothetical protein